MPSRGSASAAGCPPPAREPADRSAIQDVVQPEPEHPEPDVWARSCRNAAKGERREDGELRCGQPRTFRPPVAVAAIALTPRCLTWIASANVMTDWLARARIIGAASRSKTRSGAAEDTVPTMWPSRRSCKDLEVAKAKQEILSLAGHQVTVSN